MNKPIPLKTGWPMPALAQDDCRALFRWFASKLDARRRVREAISDRKAADKALYIVSVIAVAVIAWMPQV